MKINKALKRRYAKIAEKWESTGFASLRRDDMLPSIIARMEIGSLKEDANVLEAMCGTGIVGSAVVEELKRNGQYVNIFFQDFSKEMLAKISSGSEKTCSDVRRMPFPDNFFDRIVLRDALHDIDKDSQQDAIDEIFRVLAPGGIFVLVGFYTSDATQFLYNLAVNYKDELAGHGSELKRHFPTKDEYVELLRKAGFAGIENGKNFIGTISNEKTGEMSKEAAEKWKFLMLHYPKKIRQEMNMRLEEDMLLYDFPKTIFICQKIKREVM